MSADKYPSIFSRQMEAIVYLFSCQMEAIVYIFSRQMEAIVYITPARLDICLPIVSVEEKHSQHKNCNFSFFLFNIEGN